MIKRTVEISRDPLHLSVKLNQLRLHRHGDDAELVATIPCEDLGVLVVDNAQATYSHHALAKLVEFGAAVVICGSNHLPAGLLLPLSDHTEVVWRIEEQMAAGKPLRKRLWKQIVQAKIRAQCANLPEGSPARKSLLALEREVRSGDPKNVEARAARVYWSAWLDDGESFRRRAKALDSVNAMLNYGYAVLRAAVARALVSAGLQPAIGLHHSNRGNPFCLADDLMEPLRPLVDARVRRLRREGVREINPDAKKALLGLLAAQVRLDDEEGPLMVALHRTAASLVHCLRGAASRLLIPVSCDNGQP